MPNQAQLNLSWWYLANGNFIQSALYHFNLHESIYGNRPTICITGINQFTLYRSRWAKNYEELMHLERKEMANRVNAKSLNSISAFNCKPYLESCKKSLLLGNNQIL